MACLFTYFTNGSQGDREQVWFSLSRDGLHWNDIGTDEPVLHSGLGTKGVRDPFPIYDEKLKKYFIIATDLNTSSGDWGKFACNGSRSIVVWESEDLINWSDERLVEVGIPEAGCVWAPEAVFCKEEDAWFVFWASNVKESRDADYKQRIYGAFTKDFRTFTEPFKFIDKDISVIDTNIVWDKGFYYRTSKDETNKVIFIERSEKLIPENGREYEKISSPVLDGFKGLEGPEVYYLKDLKKWCLIADQYGTHTGYLPMLTDDLSSGEFEILKPEEYSLGINQKQHGGIIEISDETAQALIEHYGIRNGEYDK